jgi:hypothetical protein
MSKELAADYFSRHLSSNECHITSDGRVFHSKGTADGFANGLKDNAVASYTRAQIEAPAVDELEDEENLTFNVPIKKIEPAKDDAPKDEALKGDAPKDDAPKDDALKGDIPKDETPKVYTLEDLKGFDTATAEYEDIKALAKGLNLESASNSKKDLIAAIENQKVIVNTEVKA